nr:MAG TPA: hypothetical protein [Caudoviricetes sp.]
MALNSRSPIHPKWVYHNRRSAGALNLATVRIYNQASSEKVYQIETNTWNGEDVDLYVGKARVQTTTSLQDAPSSFNPTTIQQIKVFVPYGGNELEDSEGVVPNISANDRLIVTNAPYDSTLQQFVFTVISSANSSNPWEKVLTCRIDVELDRLEVD